MMKKILGGTLVASALLLASCSDNSSNKGSDNNSNGSAYNQEDFKAQAEAFETSCLNIAKGDKVETIIEHIKHLFSATGNDAATACKTAVTGVHNKLKENNASGNDAKQAWEQAKEILEKIPAQIANQPQ